MRIPVVARSATVFLTMLMVVVFGLTAISPASSADWGTTATVSAVLTHQCSDGPTEVACRPPCAYAFDAMREMTAPARRAAQVQFGATRDATAAPFAIPPELGPPRSLTRA